MVARFRTILAFLTSVRFLPIGALMIFTPNLREVYDWLGKLHVHIFDRPENDL